jgi:hypothetical protein
MKKLIGLLTALFLLVSISSCSDESTQDQVLRLFSCYVNGIKRVPTNNSTMGTATSKYYKKLFTITVTHDLTSNPSSFIHRKAGNGYTSAALGRQTLW